MSASSQPQALITRIPGRCLDSNVALNRPKRCRGVSGNWVIPTSAASPDETIPWLALPEVPTLPAKLERPQAIDPFYLFACYLEWEQNEDHNAAWELISAANSADEETHAHACALLAGSQQLCRPGSTPSSEKKRAAAAESDMNTPYDLEIIENCTGCAVTQTGFFCNFSHCVRQQLDQESQKSTLPAGAILFVEGQAPRGVFIICSGKVNLSTTSREGKTLILKTGLPGEALGLSAAISGVGYETTAQTATPCQVNFVDRKHFVDFMETHSEAGLHAAQSLSRDYHAAYRDIHDLVLTRSSSGKLARLLLSISPDEDEDSEEPNLSLMTHEEIGQRIGASRETVTRLLSKLRRKKLIRLDGPNLVIQDRSGLEALAS